jgi:hypothetical protein
LSRARRAIDPDSDLYSFFAVATCLGTRIEVLSIIWTWPSWTAVVAFISRSQTPAFRHCAKRL